MNSTVVAVSLSESHTFSKTNQPAIRLIEDYGVEGDVHAGKTVKHRYLAGKDPSRPNILQVHLIQAELFDELEKKDFIVRPGDLGENITTRGIDLLKLPTGTTLKIGEDAEVKLTALRSPCKQIENFRKGLVKEVVSKNEEGNLIRKTGVMGIVLKGGTVKPGDRIVAELPPEPHQELVYTW